MNRSTIFILSDMRSGSTLLDQLLGANPSILSVGELHWLPAYVNKDRSIFDPDYELLCTCGKIIQVCDFWSQVGAKLGRPLDSLQLRLSFPRAVRRFLHRLPGAFRNRVVQRILVGPRFTADSLALFDSIFFISGRPLVVDSSKSTFRFRTIYASGPDHVRAIVFARDYRAVVHSKMKRGYSLESAAISWRNKMTEIAALTKDLPADHLHTLTYEQLCSDPTVELKRICGFLNVEFSSTMLERPRENVHHIGGSPSKFDPSRTAIAMDTDHRNAFSKAELAKLRKIVGPVVRKWGY